MYEHLKKLFVALCFFGLLVLASGCAEKGPPTVTNDYDLAEAAKLVDESEWLTTWLQTQTSISRDKAEALDERLGQLLSPECQIVPTSMDGADWEDKTLQTLPIVRDVIQPTVYYEGVSIVSATEEQSCERSEETGDCMTHFGTLTIRKEYEGDEAALRGWSLEYVFTQRKHGGDWEFFSYSGIYNAKVSLPLKAEFYEAPYDIADLA